MLVDLIMRAEDLECDELPGKTAIVIDVLRATSTIVTAMANGCQAVIPVLTPEEAIRYQALLPEGSYLLAGERHGLPIAGFNLGNSPREYCVDTVKGKTIVMTTSNGTRAIKGGEKARAVLIGSFLNARAVAVKTAALDDDAVIVCAGTQGRFSLDDFLAAGAILHRLKQINPLAECTDSAQGAVLLFEACQEQLEEALGQCKHGRILRDLGFECDLEFCTSLDRWNIVPVYRNGKITGSFW